MTASVLLIVRGEKNGNDPVNVSIENLTKPNIEQARYFLAYCHKGNSQRMFPFLRAF
jgi:hypothetical protein